MGLTIRGTHITDNGKTKKYLVSGLEKQIIERKLRRMPIDEYEQFLRENNYTLVAKK